MGPDDVDILRRPVYRFKEAVAEHWQDGRVFLAGDAAHVLWPFAGEGMCNGIRDASTLAWRLDLVLRGLASPSMLDSYTADRKPVFVAWMNLSREIGLPCVITDPAIAEMRNQGMKAALADPSLAPPLPEIPGPKSFSRPGDPTAGTVGYQGIVEADGSTGLFDDVVGNGWVLLTARLSRVDRSQRCPPGHHRSPRHHHRPRGSPRVGCPDDRRRRHLQHLARVDRRIHRPDPPRLLAVRQRGRRPLMPASCSTRSPRLGRRFRYPRPGAAARRRAGGLRAKTDRAHRRRGHAPWRAEVEAHKRAMPMQRLIGNGMDYADVVELYALADSGVPWADAGAQAR